MRAMRRASSSVSVKSLVSPSSLAESVPVKPARGSSRMTWPPSASTATKSARPVQARARACRAPVSLRSCSASTMLRAKSTTPPTRVSLLCETRVGGVVLFARNIVDAEQLRRLTGALQARARACTGRALFVAVDAEGGRVMRLDPGAGFTGTLSAQELGETNDLTLTELEARRIARMLRAAGINWDLAPVVDVGYNPANPVIVGAARSFGANPVLVTAHARAFVRGMREEGVLTALKHFPGHGSSYDDSHKGFVDVTGTADADVELYPYRTLIAEGMADTVITAHVFNRALDERYPATLSRATLTGLLRGGLGWDGPVVTDDPRLGAIEERYRLAPPAVTALP